MTRRQLVSAILGLLAILALGILCASGAEAAEVRYHYLGPYVWRTDEMGARWQVPDGTLGGVDLRTLADMGMPGPTAKGVAFFCTDRPLAAPYVALGADLNAPMPAAALVAWKDALGWVPSPPATPLSALWEALTEQSDGEGKAGPKPLDPTAAGNLQLRLGGHPQAKSERFECKGNHWQQIKKMRQAGYKAIREEALKGKTDKEKAHHRRVMASWIRKYKCDYHELLGGEPDEPPLSPETTIVDDFTRGDGTTIGNQLSWTEYGGDTVTVSNAVESAATNFWGHCRADSDLSGTDHYGQIDILRCGNAATYDNAGPVARFSSSANTQYLGYFYQNDDKLYIAKVVAGTITVLTAGAAITPSFPEAYKLECNGSTIKLYQAGVERESVVDTSITTGTRCGFAGRDKSTATRPRMDNFEASDLAVAGPAIPVLLHHYRQQGSH